jgi:predicted HAD superfamily phosphohydrolase YqeG
MRSFVIAQGNEEKVELTVVTQLKGRELEEEGNAFGLWLLENASTPFLRGLAEALDEAEIRKKVGLGY